MTHFVQNFRDSAPYIHAHRNKTFVLLLTGEALASDRINHLVSDITLLSSLGVKLVLVVGARPQIDAELQKNGTVCEYFQDLRITDQATLDAIIEVNGKLRVELESRFSLGLINSPMFNSKIQLVSGNFVTAQPLGVLQGVDLKHTGKVRNINSTVIRQLLDHNHLVLMPHIGYSLSGEVYNLSAEDIAVRTAVAIQADKLIVVGHTDFVAADNTQLSVNQCQQLLASKDPHAQGFRELHAISEACRLGVSRCHLVDYQQDGAILTELYTRDGQGIMVSQDQYDVLRAALQTDVAGILELLAPLEARGILKVRSQEMIENEIQHYTVLERDGMIIGCAALYEYTNDNTAEMASVAIHQDYQKGGRGDQLLNSIEKQAKARGLHSIFVLTTQTTHWFIERGFVDISISDLPEEKQRHYDGSRKSKALRKVLISNKA